MPCYRVVVESGERKVSPIITARDSDAARQKAVAVAEAMGYPRGRVAEVLPRCVNVHAAFATAVVVRAAESLDRIERDFWRRMKARS